MLRKFFICLVFCGIGKVFIFFVFFGFIFILCFEIICFKYLIFFFVKMYLDGCNLRFVLCKFENIRWRCCKCFWKFFENISILLMYIRVILKFRFRSIFVIRYWKVIGEFIILKVSLLNLYIFLWVMKVFLCFVVGFKGIC